MKEDKKTKHTRPSWDDYFIGIMNMIGNRGTCDRGRSGSIVVKNKHLLTSGYVGSPIGSEHCDDVGHEIHRVVNDDGTSSQHCIRTIHAEQNAITQAARMGIALEGSIIYCKMTPCYTCAKLIINAGIIRVVATKDYHASKKTKKLFKDSDITFDLIDSVIENYENQN